MRPVSFELELSSRRQQQLSSAATTFRKLVPTQLHWLLLTPADSFPSVARLSLLVALHVAAVGYVGDIWRCSIVAVRHSGVNQSGDAPSGGSNSGLFFRRRSFFPLLLS
ncbi:unnamed protein product [Cuscuta europaea]|uniref:Uncharacterized protein n=1 Tax=Cuscuta europaea TaxID=41803 RepID=A0A9P0ZYP8_CUSEU|nr:unnamed protein product [Cuscuta europaea]